jgi:hypothetical protein
MRQVRKKCAKSVIVTTSPVVTRGCKLAMCADSASVAEMYLWAPAIPVLE